MPELLYRNTLYFKGPGLDATPNEIVESARCSIPAGRQSEIAARVRTGWDLACSCWVSELRDKEKRPKRKKAMATIPRADDTHRVVEFFSHRAPVRIKYARIVCQYYIF